RGRWRKRSCEGCRRQRQEENNEEGAQHASVSLSVRVCVIRRVQRISSACYVDIAGKAVTESSGQGAQNPQRWVCPCNVAPQRLAPWLVLAFSLVTACADTHRLPPF